MVRKILLFSILLVVSSASAQETVTNVLKIEGIVHGYFHDPAKKLFKKEKQVVMEGTLSAVSVSLIQEGKIIQSTTSDKNGNFIIKLSFGKIYTLRLSREGYFSSVLFIDIREFTDNVSNSELTYNGVDFMLNSYIPKDTSEVEVPFGKLYFDKSLNQLQIEPYPSKYKRSGIPIELLKKSIEKNKNNQFAPLSVSDKQLGLKKDLVKTKNTANKNSNNTSDKKQKQNGSIITGNQDLVQRERELQNAKEQLERDKQNALTYEDSLKIREREAQLNMAMADLETAKKTIELQKNEISTRNNLLIFVALIVLLLIGFIVVAYSFYKQKQKHNEMLNEKNKKITESINYAKRIQESILFRDNDIKDIIKQAFVFFQPKDIVSGDFYWFSKHGNKIIIAGVDCTGHGVPGAFMSLIGNTLLHEIIIEKEILNPSEILNKLHKGIVKSLRQNEGEDSSKDGMDIALCIVDINTKTLEYAGAMNPLYVIKDNEVTIYKADKKGIGGGFTINKKYPADFSYTTHTVNINNASVYIFSDGYMDQFGGAENVKFGTTRFKNLLLEVNGKDMSEQKHIFEQTINNWKGNKKQLDDLLVIGFRI